MTRTFTPFALILLSGIFLSTTIADELDDAFSKVTTWKSNDDLAPLQKIKEAAIDALNGKLDRDRFEKALINGLRAASTRRSRSLLCRQLRIVGTDACIPVLTEMLKVADSSHMARYALGSISTPATRAALFSCLDETEGAVQIGIIDSIGDLGADGAEAINALTKLLADAKPPVAMAAASALGEIATPAALTALQARYQGPTGSFRQTIETHSSWVQTVSPIENLPPQLP